MFFFKKDIRKVLPAPFSCRHSEYSMIFSLDDDPAQPSETLISLALESIRMAREANLDQICRRMKKPPYYPKIWPGEHYKLLAGLVAALGPEVIVEIGTSMGLSALAMRKYLPKNSKILTFDLQDWRSHPDYCLREEDFSDGRLIQFLEDLSDPAVCARHRPFLEKAGLIFLDAEKDGISERKFLENFARISFRHRPILVLDDIRLWKMLRVWREIPFPKLDITSFGHWSGTGIVEFPGAGSDQRK